MWKMWRKVVDLTKAIERFDLRGKRDYFLTRRLKTGSHGRKLWKLPMKIRLAYKIFAAFLLTSFMVVALMVAIMRFSVSRHFADYVNKTALDRLDNLTADLAAEFQAHQGWAHLKDDPDLWQDMLRSRFRQSDFERASPVRRPDEKIVPSVPETRDSSEKDDVSKLDHRESSFRRPKAGSHLDRLARGLAVFDLQKRLIAGGPIRGNSDNYTLRAITVDDKTVGWLGLHKRDRLTNRLVGSFLREQSLVFYYIGGSILVLAGIVAFLLSKHFLAPIRQLIEGTRALRAFKFDTKIDVRTKDELGQLAADFNKMADTLKRYEEMRRQWVSDISHELRTPLAILRGEIEALQDGVREPGEATLESLHSEVVRLGKLVEDLHSLSLADSQSLLPRRDQVKPLEILKEMVADFRTRLAPKGIDVKLALSDSEDIEMEGDADRLAQLFSNLLENTVRYTDSPGSLNIYARHTEDRLTISFEDSGPGVPKDSLARLFDRLYRVDKSRSRELGGTGLGLAICKQIAEAHGGTIRAAEASSGGLLIQIELPRKPVTSAGNR